jgi:diguanylate cyclase (GGDEF)-like protein
MNNYIRYLVRTAKRYTIIKIMKRRGHKLEIRTKVSISIAGMMSLVFIITLISLLTMLSLTNTIDKVMEESTHEGQPLLDLLRSVQKSDIEAHDFLTYSTDSERNEYIESAESTIMTFKKTLKAPFEHVKEKEFLRSAFIKWKVAHNLIMSHDPDHDPAYRLKQMRKIDSQMDAIEAYISQALKQMQEEMGEMSTEASKLRDHIMLLMALIFFIALIVSVTSWFWLVRGITAPLNEMAKIVRSVGLDQAPIELKEHTDDELGRLVRAINDMSNWVSESTSHLKELAERDELTGLYNHRALIMMLEDEIARSKRYKQPFSFVLLDIDNFKEINDTYGHVAGDEAIRQFAPLILESIREVDKVARYGGDEIAVIMPETPGTEAVSLAERIRIGVGAQQVLLKNIEMITLHISVGVAEYPGGKDSLKDLVSAADEALYEAKKSGRNKVCVESWIKKKL